MSAGPVITLARPSVSRNATSMPSSEVPLISPMARRMWPLIGRPRIVALAPVCYSTRPIVMNPPIDIALQ